MSVDRKHTRQRSEKEVLVGTPVKEGHANFMLMYDMLTGIRVAVSRCEAKLPRDTVPSDYRAAHKFAFDSVGNELTPSSKYDFKFKDYAPWIFRQLRLLFRIDPAEYLLSLTDKYILSELGSPGKSGSFFYYSSDYRFIIKTIHHTEHELMLNILPYYLEHVRANPYTLLSRIFGLHRVKLPHNRKIHFVVMGNVFPSNKDIHEMYDLKGSTMGREYPEKDTLRNPRAVMKDLNWIKREKRLHLGPKKRQLFFDQLEKDVRFLVKHNIMDYSLLIGIHDLRKGNKENIRDTTLGLFETGPDNSRSMATSVAGQVEGGKAQRQGQSVERTAEERLSRQSKSRRSNITVAPTTGTQGPRSASPNRLHARNRTVDGGQQSPFGNPNLSRTFPLENNQPSSSQSTGTHDDGTLQSPSPAAATIPPSAQNDSAAPVTEGTSESKQIQGSNQQHQKQFSDPGQTTTDENSGQQSLRNGESSRAAERGKDVMVNGVSPETISTTTTGNPSKLPSNLQPQALAVDRTAMLLTPSAQTSGYNSHANSPTVGWTAAAVASNASPSGGQNQPRGPSSNYFSTETPMERAYCIFYRDEGGFRSTDKFDRPSLELYYLGVIDIFTKYSFVKRGETVWKSIGRDPMEISSVKPKLYGKRFIEFIKKSSEPAQSEVFDA